MLVYDTVKIYSSFLIFLLLLTFHSLFYEYAYFFASYSLKVSFETVLRLEI